MTENTHNTSPILAPVSIGELIDKITILEIKKQNMEGSKLQNVEKELSSLKNTIKRIQLKIDNDLFEKLKIINQTLWLIEDKIRVKESKQEFDQGFIDLARSVYKQNDKRALIKKEINYKYNSDLVEEKTYKKY